MDLKCPRCGTLLEVEQMRVGALIQCAACGDVFRGDEGAPRSTLSDADVIDITAEVVSGNGAAPEANVDGDHVEMPQESSPTDYNNSPATTAYTAYEDATDNRDRVLIKRQVIVQQREGCGCGSCGCLIALFLLFLLLIGCGAATMAI